MEIKLVILDAADGITDFDDLSTAFADAITGQMLSSDFPTENNEGLLRSRQGTVIGFWEVEA